MPWVRCATCHQLVRQGAAYEQHRNAHRGNQTRGWSARNRSDQRRFRKAVLARDGHRCTLVVNGLRCPATSDLVAHHTTPLHKGGTFDPHDGVTLCRGHHQEVDRHAR